MAKKAWSTFTANEWAQFTADQWGQFLLDPDPNKDFKVTATAVFDPVKKNQVFVPSVKTQVD